MEARQRKIIMILILTALITIQTIRATNDCDLKDVRHPATDCTIHTASHIQPTSDDIIDQSYGYKSRKILLYPVSIDRTSHMYNMEKLGRVLANAGHSVSILASDSYNIEEAPIDMTGIDHISYQGPNVTSIGSFTTLDDMLYRPIIEMAQIFYDATFAFCDQLLSEKTLIKSIKDMEFDLVIYESFDQCSKILADEISAPFIVFYTGGTHSVYPRNPAFQPAVMSDYHSVMTFPQRVMNNVFNLIQYLYGVSLENRFNKLRVKYQLQSQSAPQGFTRASLRFILGHPVLDYPGTYHANHVMLGGYIEGPKQTLDPSLKKVLDSSTEGVVLFSLGSLVKTDDLKWIQHFNDIFSFLPYKVIWKLSGQNEQHFKLADNVYTSSWLPVTTVLSHRNVKAFITHAGSNSVHEAATHGVPCIVVPLHREQNHQAQKLVGGIEMAIKLDIRTMTSESLRDALFKLIETPKYKENAERVSQIMKLKPRSQKEEILYWVNYVIVTNGATHLRSPGEMQLNWFQVNNYDVYLFIFLTISLILFLLKKYFLPLIWKCIKYIITIRAISYTMLIIKTYVLRAGEISIVCFPIFIPLGRMIIPSFTSFGPVVYKPVKSIMADRLTFRG